MDRRGLGLVTYCYIVTKPKTKKQSAIMSYASHRLPLREVLKNVPIPGESTPGVPA